MVSLETKIELPQFGDTIAIPTYFISESTTQNKIDSKTGLYKKDKKGNYIIDYYRDEKGEILTAPEYQRDKKGRYIRDNNGKKIPTGGRVNLVHSHDIWIIDNVGNQTINKTRQLSSRKGQKFLNLGVGKVKKIEDINVTPRILPKLKDFPEQKDRDLLIQLITHPVTRLTQLDEYPHNKTRGRPPILKKNWDYHKLGKLPESYDKHKEKEDIFGQDSDNEEQSKAISHKDIFGEDSDEEENETPPESVSSKETKKKGRPKKHKTKEEAYKAKLQSNKDKRAEKRIEERKIKIKEKLEKGEKLTKKEKELQEMEGGSLKDIFNNIKETTKKVGNKIKEYGNVIINGRNDYQPKVRKILSKYGDKPIQNISIIRAPVPSLLTSALSTLSFGQFGQNLSNSPYDTLFHLSLLISIDNVKLILEKNEVINMDINPKLSKETEMKNIPIKNGLTINGLLENAKKSMGGKYFTYSARDNNCQDFILAVLNSNNIGNEEDKKFIKQDTKSLFDNLPSLRKISNTITDLGAKVNEITTGAGIDFDKTKWGTFTALYKRFIKEHPIFKDKIQDLEHFADFVLENKDKFSKIAEKKALFYKNILEHKK